MVRKKENKPSLTIIILNFNAGRFLEECLTSLTKAVREDEKKGSYSLKEIIVVDNNSTDESKKYLEGLGAKKLYSSKPSSTKPLNHHITKPKLKVIFNDKNLGFAAGNNVGVRAALKKKPDYILFLNPDTVVFPGTLKEMVSFLESHPRVGAVSCYLELANGKLDEASHRGFPTPWRAFCHFSGLEKLFPKSRFFAGYTLGFLREKKSPHEIDSCSGSCMMVRREVGEKVGWWDEDYFFYGEDLDFCYRIKKAGWRIFFLPQVKIIHYRGVTSGILKHSEKISRAKKETRIRAARASTEAMRIFYRKHYLNSSSFLTRALVLGGIKLLEFYRVLRVKIKNKR